MKILFPPEHKKRLVQGLAAFAAVALLAGGYAWHKTPAARTDHAGRTPHATAEVRTVYMTPQITETGGAAFDDTGGMLAPGGGGYVALVMTGLGLEDGVTERAIADLPAAVGLAFSPYGDAEKWLRKARGAEHETFILLPMEPLDFPKNDPGPQALLTRAATRDNAQALSRIMAAGKGATGAMNFMGSAFLSDRKNLESVFKTLGKENMFFIEQAQAGERTSAEETAQQAGFPYIPTDIEIDSRATETDIGQQLVALEKLARERRYALGVAAPYPVSFNLIKSWAENLDRRGIKLVPVSVLLKIRARHGSQQQKQE